MNRIHTHDMDGFAIYECRCSDPASRDAAWVAKSNDHANRDPVTIGMITTLLAALILGPFVAAVWTSDPIWLLGYAPEVFMIAMGIIGTVAYAMGDRIGRQ